MGFQSQEQRGFQGLFTTVRGATAPRWSASDVRNIDFRSESIKGRPPTERVISTPVPQHARFYDGSGEYSESDYNDDDFSLNDLTNNSQMALRVYVTGLDLNRLTDAPEDTKWVIAGSTGNSTSFGFGDTAGMVEGWQIYLHRTASQINLYWDFVEYDGVTPLNKFMRVTDFQQFWDSEQDAFLLQIAWSTSGNRTFKGSKNGAATWDIFDNSESAGSTHIRLVNTGVFFLTIGAFRANTGQRSNYFDGIISSLEIWNNADVTDATTMWLSWNESDFDTDVAVGTLLFLYQPDEGEGSTTPALGAAAWTSSGAGNILHYPLPTRLVSSQLALQKGAWAEADLNNLVTDPSKSWMFLVEFNIPEQSIDFTEPPWILTTEESNIVVAVNSGGGDFEVRAIVGLFDASGDPDGVINIVTARGLSFDTTYKLAVVIEPSFETRITDGEIFLNVAGVWTSEGTDVGNAGSPLMKHTWYFATDPDQTRVLDVNLGAFRIYNNFKATPAVAADVAALDIFPGDVATDIGFPDRLAVSFDAADADSVTSETTVDSFARVTSVRDNFTGAYSLIPKPEGGRAGWSTIAHLARGLKPKIFGIHPSIVQRGMLIEHFYNFLLPGGIYRYDLLNLTGKWFQHRNFTGCPTSGVRGIDQKDRLLLFGEDFGAIKVFPRGATSLGLRAPGVSIVVDSLPSGNLGGGLVAETAYTLRVSVYNSETDEESNLSQGSFTFTTAALHDTLTLKIAGLRSRDSEDWDSIRIYRKAQVSGIYHLDSELPRPNMLPALGPDITFEITALEADLILQPEEGIDNDPPPAFTAAALANNTLHVGGGGVQPGWVYFSKIALTESFPPLNIWQLDNDPGNVVRGIVSMFGRILILKERGLWGAAEDAGETGTQPQQIHRGRGLASNAGMTLADNVLFWMSSDRAVYATDGLEIEDISSDFIRETILELTDAQVSGVQAAHDAKNKQVWFLIPGTTSGGDRMVLVFNYVRRRWTRYELGADSIQSGHDSVGSAGDFVVVGFGGHAYKIGDAITAEESRGDATIGSQASFDYEDTGGTLLKDVDGNVIGFKQLLPGTFADWVGVPVIVVTHDTIFDSTDPEYHPLYDDAESEIYYTYIAGVRDGVDDFVYLGHRIPLSSRQFAWVGYGVQKRFYESQWIAPQGEDRQYLFFGTTFVQDDQVDNDRNLVRHFFEHRSGQETPTFFSNSRLTGRDRSYAMRRRGRRFRYQILGEVNTRDEQLNYRRVMWRYQTRGPVRRRGA